MRNTLRALCAATALAGCDNKSYRLEISISQLGITEPGQYQLVGDTLRLVAWELEQAFMASEEGSRPNSASAPKDYTWTTTDTSVAKMISPGTFVLRSAGAVRINAWTDRAGDAFELTVCEAGSVFTVEPQDPTIDLGQSITFTHVFGIPGQTPCFTRVREISRISATEPTVLSWSAGATYVAVEKGTSRYNGVVGVGTRQLRDTILVTVR